MSSMPYAIDTNYQPAYYVQTQAATGTGGGKEEEDISILTSGSETKPEKLDVDTACTDGKNDGKLEDGVFGLFVKKTGEGLLKKIASPVTEALKGNFVPALVTAAGIALACNPVTGPFVLAIGTGAAALGVASSAVAVGSDIKALNECANTEGTTDADAKAIVAQMGDHAANGILSLTALIGGVKAMRNRAGTNLNDLKLKAASGEKVTLREQLGAYGKDTFKAGKDMVTKGFGKLTTPVRTHAEMLKDKQAQQQYAKDNNLGDKKMSQEEIDALLKDIDADTAAQQKYIQDNGLDGQQVMSQKDIDALIKDSQIDLDGKMSQSDIDKLIQSQQQQNSQRLKQIEQIRQNNTKATNTKLTVEQAQSELDEAINLLNDRGNTRADYKAAQQLVKEAQLNLDYAQDKANRLLQLTNRRQAQQLQQGIFIEPSGGGQMEINFNYPGIQAA